jgi:glycosyltransferase involved in cell wall biosynthesis
MIQLEKNYGAAYARQVAIDNSNGDLIAFCDSDDLWHPEKLSEQVNFMMLKKYDFTYTNYAPFHDVQKKYKSVIYSSTKDYFGLLIHSLGNSTVMIKGDICRSTRIPLIKKRNDYLYFLQIIKKTKKAHLLKKTLTFYRLNKNGLSKNKFDLIKYHWKVYRQYERLNFFISVFLIFVISVRKILSLLYTRF